jgi:hypothetical protein
MGLIPENKMLDMGVLYYLVFGIAGVGGSFLAGLMLDVFKFFEITPFFSFKILYAAIIVLTVIGILLQRKLTPLGALPLAGAVKVMFSYRDLLAISLLDRLNKTIDSEKEEKLLDALYNTPSRLSEKGLLERAQSPRLATRMESIRALGNLDHLTEDAETALINDIVNNPFTTAYFSARILGNHGCFRAIPMMRELAASSDYMLAGEAMIALAKLGDTAFCPQIEQIVLKTENPRLKIMGVESLGIYGSPNSLFILIDILRESDPPPYLRDGVVLAMSAILETQQQFYPILVRFIADHSICPALAMDEAETTNEFFLSNLSKQKRRFKKNEFSQLERQVKNIQPAVSSLVYEENGRLLSRWILELPAFPSSADPAFEIAKTVFSEALLDDELIAYKRLHLLIANWAAFQIKAWVKRLKDAF